MVYWNDKCGFVALPRSKNAETALNLPQNLQGSKDAGAHGSRRAGAGRAGAERAGEQGRKGCAIWAAAEWESRDGEERR
ncbi:hypothetical protein ACOSQ4_006456 [Xanthoceras sorbifolium]